MPIDSIGTIFGETGFADFRFTVSDPSTKQGDYLKIWHELDGWVLAQVVAITRLDGDRDDSNADRVVAKAMVIGSRQKKDSKDTKNPV